MSYESSDMIFFSSWNLGEDESGKTTLIARLQQTEDPKKGHALEYHYLNVRDEDRDGK